jgi:hypothetical protein
MTRNRPCAHLRPDYSRLDDAAYIHRNPITDEIHGHRAELRKN